MSAGSTFPDDAGLPRDNRITGYGEPPFRKAGNSRRNIGVAGISDGFDPPTSGASERRFDGSALSEVRKPPRSAAIQSDIILGNCYIAVTEHYTNLAMCGVGKLRPL